MYYKKIVQALKEMGFEGAGVDHCRVYKRSKLGLFIKKEFGAQVEKLRRCLTPGTPSVRLFLKTDPKLVLLESIHHRYRKGIGMLLYLVKFSRPDITNVISFQNLSGPTEATSREMLRVVKYVLTTGDLGLKMVADTVSTSSTICTVARIVTVIGYWTMIHKEASVGTLYINYVNRIPVC
ncbi:LOW QUALITY PROTEIN: hypothetical protein ACHAWF_005015 [Thalassiosira exigua]